MQSLEQRRAKDAWEKSKCYTENEVNVAKELPALIINSGLMQAVAFLESKKDSHYKTVGNHLRAWLTTQFSIPSEFSDFMNCLLGDVDSQTYQAMTSEAMAWLKWLRYMAAAQRNLNSTIH